jgi:superfamily I DNA and RNA helicase
VGTQIIAAITDLAKEHTALTPDDVGIILLDTGDSVYTLADQLAVKIPRVLGWSVNKAHESKRRVSGELFISNRNNVKGLEFPFVICVSRSISSSYTYRNSLYMTLTRSFIQSRLIISEDSNTDTLDYILQGLERINTEGVIEVSPPSDAEKKGIQTTFKLASNSLSFFDMANKVFEELGVIQLMRPQLFEALKVIGDQEPDLETIRETADFLYKKMMRSRN